MGIERKDYRKENQEVVLSSQNHQITLKVCIYNEVWATKGPGRAPVRGIGEEGLPFKVCREDYAVRINRAVRGWSSLCPLSAFKDLEELPKYL